eukprot:gnl/MRDRNA2_/MRDRNA2_92269_c0_seq1.p1 gnl/MRDRNA2_/MRDRNA2_92269_c0~~gnl/MRDRNA2_/MRDRNA2_92269_c0_seq1.p1  ORF type:complete len:236 (+),score=45.10 gnl/MRDRNA2_/MRDRNA2_92269_c0_seq1:109-816(+)
MTPLPNKWHVVSIIMLILSFGGTYKFFQSWVMVEGGRGKPKHSHLVPKVHDGTSQPSAHHMQGSDLQHRRRSANPEAEQRGSGVSNAEIQANRAFHDSGEIKENIILKVSEDEVSENASLLARSESEKKGAGVSNTKLHADRAFNDSGEIKEDTVLEDSEDEAPENEDPRSLLSIMQEAKGNKCCCCPKQGEGGKATWLDENCIRDPGPGVPPVYCTRYAAGDDPESACDSGCKR